MEPSPSIKSSFISTFFIPFINFDGIKQKTIETMTLILVGNTLWNTFRSNRTTQAVINLTGATTLWMAQNIVIHQKLSENVISLGTWITTLQETIKIQEEHIKKMEETSDELSRTSKGLKATGEDNEVVAKELRNEVERLQHMLNEMQKIINPEHKSMPSSN